MKARAAYAAGFRVFLTAAGNIVQRSKDALDFRTFQSPREVDALVVYGWSARLHFCALEKYPTTASD